MEKLITLTNLQKYDEKIKKHTKDYTDTKVAELVGSAPELLDTLEELALALGENANFATTITESIGKKADKTELDNYLPLAGGDLSGSLNAPVIAADVVSLTRTNSDESATLFIDSELIPVIKTPFTKVTQKLRVMAKNGDKVSLGIPSSDGKLALVSDLESKVSALSTKIQDGTITAHTAAHDASGNDIAATYARKDGTEFTGSVTFTSTLGSFGLGVYTGDIPLITNTDKTAPDHLKLGFMGYGGGATIYTFPNTGGVLALKSEVTDLQTNIGNTYATKEELGNVSDLLTYATNAEVEALFS